MYVSLCNMKYYQKNMYFPTICTMHLISRNLMHKRHHFSTHSSKNSFFKTPCRKVAFLYDQGLSGSRAYPVIICLSNRFPPGRFSRGGIIFSPLKIRLYGSLEPRGKKCVRGELFRFEL